MSNKTKPGRIDLSEETFKKGYLKKKGLKFSPSRRKEIALCAAFEVFKAVYEEAGTDELRFNTVCFEWSKNLCELRKKHYSPAEWEKMK